MSALKNKNHRKSCDKYFTKIVVTFLLGKYEITKLTQEEVRNMNKLIPSTILKIPLKYYQIIKDTWPKRFYKPSRSKQY